MQANVFNLREKKVIRDLNPEDIEQLVSVSGMVTRCSNIIPEIRSARFPNPKGFPCYLPYTRPKHRSQQDFLHTSLADSHVSM